MSEVRTTLREEVAKLTFATRWERIIYLLEELVACTDDRNLFFKEVEQLVSEAVVEERRVVVNMCDKAHEDKLKIRVLADSIRARNLK